MGHLKGQPDHYVYIDRNYSSLLGSLKNCFIEGGIFFILNEDLPWVAEKFKEN